MEEPIVPATRRARHFWVAAAVASVWGVSVFPVLFGLARCPTALLFRVACPGCGMTRALHLLAEGRVVESLTLQPFAAPMLLAEGAFAAATVITTYLSGAPWAILGTKWGRGVTAVGAVVVVLDVLLWVARMLGAFGGPVPV